VIPSLKGRAGWLVIDSNRFALLLRTDNNRIFMKDILFWSRIKTQPAQPFSEGLPTFPKLNRNFFEIFWEIFWEIF
jgi:hypothetical protein